MDSHSISYYIDWGHVIQWLAFFIVIGGHIAWKIRKDTKIESSVDSTKESCREFKAHISNSDVQLAELNMQFDSLEARIERTEQNRRSDDKLVTLKEWKIKNEEQQKDIQSIIKQYDSHTERIYDRLNKMDEKREVACTDRDDKFEMIHRELSNSITQTAKLTGSVDGLQKAVDIIMQFILDKKAGGIQ